MDSPRPDIAELIKKIEDGAPQVHEVAKRLTSQIETVEAWLRKLRGKVPASCNLYVYDDQEQADQLALDRDGKEWSLYLQTTHYDGEESFSNRRLLRDSTLEEKVSALSHLPSLLEAVLREQTKRVSWARETADRTEELLRSLGVVESPPGDEFEQRARKIVLEQQQRWHRQNSESFESAEKRRLDEETKRVADLLRAQDQIAVKKGGK